MSETEIQFDQKINSHAPPGASLKWYQKRRKNTKNISAYKSVYSWIKMNKVKLFVKFTDLFNSQLNCNRGFCVVHIAPSISRWQMTGLWEGFLDLYFLLISVFQTSNTSEGLLANTCSLSVGKYDTYLGV